MNISTNTETFDKLGDVEKILINLKKAGFDCYDYTMMDNCKNTNLIFKTNWKESALKLREYADSIGITCNQSHAPFPSWIKGEVEYNNKRFEEIIKAIEITSILGGNICVVHPFNNASAKENSEFYNNLLPYAKKHNVKIGLENMFNWVNNTATCAACSSPEDFLAHLELLDQNWFVANVDIGHAEMQGLNTSAVEMLLKLNNRVKSLHIHDNNLRHDLHAIPYTLKIDFDCICKTLKEIKYTGDITLEIDPRKFLPTNLIFEQMTFMAKVATHLKQKVIE